MRILGCMLAGLLLSAALSYPADAASLPFFEAADLTPAFGNTVVSTLPGGGRALLWFEPDGRYTAALPGGVSSGHWSVRGGQVCLRQEAPFFIPFRYCTDAPSGGVGAVWQSRAPSGETLTLTLVRGRGG